MGLAQIMLNIGNVLVMSALAVRDILILRLILSCGQISLFMYNYLQDSINAALWNLVFFIINTYWAIKLILERRPIELPEGTRDLFDRIFRIMTRREFLYLWHLGNRKDVENTMLIQKGDKQQDLALILAGDVIVSNQGTAIAQLSRGSFIAEMSFIQLYISKFKISLARI